MGKVGFTVQALLLALILESVANAQTLYSVTDLGVLVLGPNASSHAQAINNLGQVVGYSQSGFSHGFIWDSVNGMQSLGNPPIGPSENYPAAINDAGQVVGYYRTSFLTFTPFIWSSQTGIQSISAQTNGVATGINSSGVVTVNSGSEAYTWTSTGGLVDLGGPNGYGRFANGINDAGTVAGGLYGGANLSWEWNYPQGNFVGGWNGLANAINNSGVVVGQAFGAVSQQYHAALQGPPSGTFGSFQDLGVLSGTTSSQAWAINTNSQVVGDSDSRAFLWSAGAGMVDLNTRLNNSGSGWNLVTARGINNAGQITGTGLNPQGQARAFLLTPSTMVQQTVSRTPNPNYLNIDVPSPTQLLVYHPGQGFIQGGQIDPTLPTIVLTHSFIDNPGTWSTDLANAYYAKGSPINILAWDWHTVAAKTFPEAELSTFDEGFALGEALNAKLGTNYKQPIHFIGHSLGTFVNAEAVSIFNDQPTNDAAKTQVTLLDAAEPGTLVSPATPVPPSNTYAYLDNYISAFGNPQPGSQNANILLNQSSAPPGLLYLDLLAYHAYPHQWYGTTVSQTGETSSLGAAWGIENTSPAPFPGGKYFSQVRSPGDPYTLNQISAFDMELAIGARNVAEGPALLGTAVPYLLGDTLIKASIQVVGNVKNPLIFHAATGIGPSYGLELILEGGGGVLAPKALAPVPLAPAPLPAYAWVPVDIPLGAQTLSFDFMYSGLDPNDYLAVGIGDTQIFRVASSIRT